VTQALMPTYGERTLTFVRGEGTYLFDANGRRFLDFGAGIAVTSIGHSNPVMVKALQEQVATVLHTSNLYLIPGQVKAADRLCANSFADVVFFGNSGAEANEGLIKLIRKYQAHNGHPERYRIVTVEGAFHGRTLATIAAGGSKKHLEGFGPPTDGFDQVPFGNMNALRNAITKETAGVLIEPIQGEGGIRPMDLDYIREVRKACDEFGILMGLDEVQCGIGRTGKLFAYEWAGIEPDVMSLAKGLGGGVPVGAVLATKKAAVGMVAGTHGSTYGGNPLSTAAVNAVLDVILADGFLDHVQEVAAYLREKAEGLVAKYPHVFKSVRGAGLMLGLVAVLPNGEVVAAATKNGLLTVPAGDNVVRLLPPLTVGKADIDEAIAILDKTAAAMATA
jgi:acetylornithine/N-succinyldiaminopimelate aminotransferase